MRIHVTNLRQTQIVRRCLPRRHSVHDPCTCSHQHGLGLYFALLFLSFFCLLYGRPAGFIADHLAQFRRIRFKDHPFDVVKFYTRVFGV